MKRMKIERNFAAALLSAVCAIVVAISLNGTALAQASELKAVTDVLTQEAAAVERGDLTVLDKLWANTEDVTVFESGHANYGWDDYRNHHLAPELKEFKNTKYSFTDLKVKVDGKTAWATFKYSLSAEMDYRKVESGGLGTAILEKRDGKWRIVHWHSSAPRKQPTQPATKS